MFASRWVSKAWDHSALCFGDALATRRQIIASAKYRLGARFRVAFFSCTSRGQRAGGASHLAEVALPSPVGKRAGDEGIADGDAILRPSARPSPKGTES